MAWELDITECVDVWQRAGLEGIGVTVPQVDRSGRARGFAALRNSRLSVSSVQGVPIYDAARRDEVLRDLDLAAELGAESVHALTGPRRGRSWEEAAAEVVEVTIAVLPELRGRGLRLAIEPMSPIRQDLSFVNTAVDAVDIVRQVDDPCVGYVFDIYHLWWQRGIEALARESVDLIACVQVSDQKPVTLRSMDRAIPGGGVIPLAGLVDVLSDAGYDGWWELEVVGEGLGGIGDVLERSVRMFNEACSS